jgi:hypothetical protein
MDGGSFLMIMILSGCKVNAKVLKKRMFQLNKTCKMESKTAKRVVLATGEGANTHAINSKTPIEYQDMGNQTIKLTVKEQSVITHEEHATIMLLPGTYYKTNQVEFNPFNNTISYVFD